MTISNHYPHISRKGIHMIYIVLATLCIVFIATMTLCRHSPEVHDKAPDFTLFDHEGNRVHLQDVIKNSAYVVLIFYPQDESTICTQQLCAIRDTLFEDAKKKNITILGINKGSQKDHKSFAQHHKFQFPLLSDTNGTVRKLYGASRLIPNRLTFIINHNGIIIDQYSELMSMTKHLAIIRRLIDAPIQR